MKNCIPCGQFLKKHNIIIFHVHLKNLVHSGYVLDENLLMLVMFCKNF